MTTTVPCRDCGRQVTDPTHTERLTVYGQLRKPTSTRFTPRDEPIGVPMTTCEDCRTRTGRARELLEAHPLARQPLGSLSFVVDLAGTALIVLDLLRVKPEQQDALTRLDRDVAMLLHRLSGVRPVRYSDRPSPVINADGEPGSRRPWQHVTEEQHQSLRDAYAALLQARTERPAEVAPPADGLPGCLLCGVGALSVLPSRSRDAWGPLLGANTAVLGGSAVPVAVYGHLCPPCSRAARSDDGRVSLGLSAVERAIFAHLGVRVPPWQDWSLPTVRAWAALPEGTHPNLSPWAHEPLDRLAEELRPR